MMSPERWKQIEHLYHAALERAPEQRAAFLDSVCSEDRTIRQEVESLLAYDEKAQRFIETPPLAMAADLLAADQASRLIGSSIGRYQILSSLGRGGMGEVYLATDTQLGRKVALKLLPAEFTADRERLPRFEQEARATSALNHPNILTIHEIGQTGGAHYIVAEYIEGETLREQLRRGPLRLTAALDVARQVASALEAAHAAGIVHRDIKPENVMVRRDGLVKVLDFGLAKLAAPEGVEADETATPLLRTRTGVVMGTVNYMSPEQAHGHAVDQRTDIFSLGVVLYEMFTGQRPFQGTSDFEVLNSIIHEEPTPVVKMNARLPAEVNDILGKALAKDIGDRYRHAGDFELDLRRLKRAIESKLAPRDRSARRVTAVAESRRIVRGC